MCEIFVIFYVYVHILNKTVWKTFIEKNRFFKKIDFIKTFIEKILKLLVCDPLIHNLKLDLKKRENLTKKYLSVASHVLLSM